MTTRSYLFEFLDFWSSPLPGQTGGPDSVCFRDSDGLPALDGDTVKGLFRDAVADLEGLGRQPEGMTLNLFGSRDTGRSEIAGTLRFSSATLSREDARIALARGTSTLFRVIQQTALENGVAKDRTLRSGEWAVPCSLQVQVTGSDDPFWGKVLDEACYLIRSAGALRHRGYGRLKVQPGPTLTEQPDGNPSAPAEAANEHWLEVELLSRTLLGSSARTVGHLESLDHIPGAALLGAAIAAGGFETRFLSDVTVTPAYPLHPDGSLALPAPLCWSTYTTGNQKHIASRCDDDDTPLAGKPSPLKGGFIHLHPVESGGTNTVSFHLPKRVFSPKSSRDPQSFDRTQDGQFFALDRLEAGQKFAFRVAGPAADEVVARLLRPGIHLGRRRNSGNGRVRIRRIPGPSIPGSGGPTATDRLRLYVWSDLALYTDGLPNLEPDPGAFHLPPGSRWLPEESALRTRSYTTWNWFHGGHERERHVIGRGSILTFEVPSQISLPADLATRLWNGIGAYTHEGFGKLLVNPGFLQRPTLAPRGSKATPTLETDRQPSPAPTTPWQRWLASQPSPTAGRETRQAANQVAARLRKLIDQQTSLNAPIPTPSQLRALVQRIRDLKPESNLREEVRRFCEPAALSDAASGDAGIRRSVRSRWWTESLLEGSAGTNLSQVLQEEAEKHASRRQVLQQALLILAAEAARTAHPTKPTLPSKP